MYQYLIFFAQQFKNLPITIFLYGILIQLFAIVPLTYRFKQKQIAFRIKPQITKIENNNQYSINKKNKLEKNIYQQNHYSAVISTIILFGWIFFMGFLYVPIATLSSHISSFPNNINMTLFSMNIFKGRITNDLIFLLAIFPVIQNIFNLKSNKTKKYILIEFGTLFLFVFTSILICKIKDTYSISTLNRITILDILHHTNNLISLTTIGICVFLLGFTYLIINLFLFIKLKYKKYGTKKLISWITSQIFMFTLLNFLPMRIIDFLYFMGLNIGHIIDTIFFNLYFLIKKSNKQKQLCKN